MTLIFTLNVAFVNINYLWAWLIWKSFFEFDSKEANSYPNTFFLNQYFIKQIIYFLIDFSLLFSSRLKLRGNLCPYLGHFEILHVFEQVYYYFKIKITVQ